VMAIFPSRAELGRYVKDHPYASVVIALVAAEAGRTVWASFVNPPGQSPFSTYWNGLGMCQECGSGMCACHGGKPHLGNAYAPNYMTRSTLSAMEEDVRSLRSQIDTSAKVPDWAESYIYTAGDRINSVDDYMKHRALGASTSTTTSTSSSHGAMPRQPALTTWDNQSSPGEKLPMFGQPRNKKSWLRGPPSLRRRVSLNLTKGLGTVGQELHEKTEELPVSEHFGFLGMVPEADPEGTDNLYL